MKTLVHGTVSGYTYKCRCEPCKAAHRVAARAKYLAKHPNAKQYAKGGVLGRCADYAEKYGVTEKQVRSIGVYALDKMTEDARLVIFSWAKWNAQNPKRKIPRRRLAEMFPDAPKTVPSNHRIPELCEKPWEPDLIFWEGIREVKPTKAKAHREDESVDRMLELSAKVARRAA